MANRELRGELLENETTVHWTCGACHWDAYAETGNAALAAAPGEIKKDFERHQCKDHEEVFKRL